ncbi:hypothetical protein CBOM_05459 [Ceraceosorus bombacis]|uniref:Uncharacterized protein n=1 Tax=Ceraceosorus bombacis TaxID=401625 RepID=A0A0P1BPC9_9BASI|nr:hypothetical protein CBOM_05459 [Ceraceosorus bombacis]
MLRLRQHSMLAGLAAVAMLFSCVKASPLPQGEGASASASSGSLAAGGGVAGFDSNGKPIAATGTVSINHNRANARAKALGVKVEDHLNGYLFISYKDETEAVYAHLSVGNSPLKYTVVNEGQPILRSEVGSKSIRDPYLISKPDRSQSWIIGTDVNVRQYNGDYGKVQRNQSRGIVIFESNGASLSDWKPARISPPLIDERAGFVNAPSAVWDPIKNAFLVTWGSAVFKTAQQDDKDQPPTFIWSAYTTDFQTFSKAQPYYTPKDGAATDMAIAALNGTTDSKSFARFFRDDTNGTLKVRGQISRDGVNGKWIDIGGTDGFVDPKNNNGGPLLFKDNIDQSRWHIWVDGFVSGYRPFETNDIAQPHPQPSSTDGFPVGSKQGNVVPLTEAQYSALSKAWDVPAPADTATGATPSTTPATTPEH